MSLSRNVALSCLLSTLLLCSLCPGSRPRSPELPALDSSCQVLRSAERLPLLVCGQDRLTASLVELTGCSLDGSTRAGEASAPSDEELVLVRASDGRGGCLLERRALAQGSRYALGRPLDLALASEAELELLPGIGPARARAIVRFREHHEVRGADDLLGVEGIGPETARRLREVCLVRGEDR